MCTKLKPTSYHSDGNWANHLPILTDAYAPCTYRTDRISIISFFHTEYVVGCATSHFAGVLHKAMDALANAKMYEVGSKRSRKFCLWSARPRCFVHLGSCVTLSRPRLALKYLGTYRCIAHLKSGFTEYPTSSSSNNPHHQIIATSNSVQYCI